MIPVLLILIPLLTGLAAFFIKEEKAIRWWSLFSVIVTLGVSLLGLTVLKADKNLHFQFDWMQTLGSSFSVKLDGLGQLLCLLTAISYTIIFTGTWNSQYKNSKNFFALMLLAQAGLMGVFVAVDALLFYFFWELALIPMYFLCSIWGGENRIRVTFKFFIYTFVGSVLMLIGILFLQSKTPGNSFALQSFYNLELSSNTQTLVFWLFFIRPQAKKQKQQKKFIDDLQKGAKIVTIAGIHGTINKVNEDGTINLEVSPGSYIKIEKSAISMEWTANLNKVATTDKK